MIIKKIIRGHIENKAQGMTEYAIISGGIIGGLLIVNAVIIPPLNDLYELMANLLSLPFP